jgi:hypothetical protein
MRTHPHELQRFCIGFSVDQDQIEFDVAISVVAQALGLGKLGETNRDLLLRII